MGSGYRPLRLEDRTAGLDDRGSGARRDGPGIAALTSTVTSTPARRLVGSRSFGSRPRKGSTTMSGHSKWATTKHKKAVVDAKRGKLFAKLIKNIEVAARTGGGDPDGNPTLGRHRQGQKNSVPNDNIEACPQAWNRARGGGADWQNITYEGYGPNGVAVLIECLTDNRNQAAGEVRVAMTRNGGKWPTRIGGLTCSPARAWWSWRRTVVRGRRPARGARGRRRGGQRPRRQLGDHPSQPIWWPSAPRCGTPGSSTTLRRQLPAVDDRRRHRPGDRPQGAQTGRRAEDSDDVRMSTPTSTFPTTSRPCSTKTDDGV